jgi:uncharacterized membrane protein
MQYNKTDYMQSNQNLESTNLYIQPSTNNTIKNREQYKKERKKKKSNQNNINWKMPLEFLSCLLTLSNTIYAYIFSK